MCTTMCVYSDKTIPFVYNNEAQFVNMSQEKLYHEHTIIKKYYGNEGYQHKMNALKWHDFLCLH